MKSCLEAPPTLCNYSNGCIINVNQELQRIEVKLFFSAVMNLQFCIKLNFMCPHEMKSTKLNLNVFPLYHA